MFAFHLALGNLNIVVGLVDSSLWIKILHVVKGMRINNVMINYFQM